MIVYLDFSVFC